MELFDDMANTALLRKKYNKEYLSWKLSLTTLSKLAEKRKELDKQSDYNQFLIEELSQLELATTDFAVY